MNWLWMVVGLAIILFFLKMVLKTVKMFFVFGLVAVVAIVFLMLRQGLIFH